MANQVVVKQVKIKELKNKNWPNKNFNPIHIIAVIAKFASEVIIFPRVIVKINFENLDSSNYSFSRRLHRYTKIFRYNTRHLEYNFNI
jgi:hypothetical protein